MVVAGTCVLILSDRSSGSSVLLRELARHPDVHAVAVTPHNENETLYWNKAAILLGRATEPLHYSTELPMPAERARADLRRLLEANLGCGALRPEPADDEELVFGGWRRLCERFGPVFLEKSPHHLHYWSALELLREAEVRMPATSFRYIGLVRHPIDALYSMWRRWRAYPEVAQHDWRRAYSNLRRFETLAGDQARTVRYEDLVADPAVFEGLCRFIGIEPTPGMGESLHATSLQQWRTDDRFGFRLDDEVRRFAVGLGYADDELHTTGHPLWPLRRSVQRARWRVRQIGAGHTG